MEIRQPKYNFTLCFETPFSTSGGGASSTTTSTSCSTAAPGGVAAAPPAIPPNNKTSAPRAPLVLPMLLPSSTPLGNSFTTPTFPTPSSVGIRGVATCGRGSSGSRAGSSFITPGSARSSIRRPPSISFSTPRSEASYRSSSNTSFRSGSNSTPNSSSSAEDQGLVIVAVVEGRGLAKGEVGVASIDLKQPVLLLSQFPDTAMYVKSTTKLLALRPIEIVMPNTINDSISKTKLFQLIQDQFTESTVTTVQRKYFNERIGLENIRKLCAPDFNSVEVDIEKKYYALSAAAALLKYVEFIQNIVFAPGSLRIKFHGSEKTTLIDVMTAKNLDLLTNSRTPSSPLSLASLLNFTKTKGGARLLRSNILEPPCHLETILLRQECIKACETSHNVAVKDIGIGAGAMFTLCLILVIILSLSVLAIRCYKKRQRVISSREMDTDGVLSAGSVTSMHRRSASQSDHRPTNLRVQACNPIYEGVLYETTPGELFMSVPNTPSADSTSVSRYTFDISPALPPPRKTSMCFEANGGPYEKPKSTIQSTESTCSSNCKSGNE